LVGSTREDYLAFTRAELAPVVPRLRARERLLTNSKGFCEEHWLHQLFFRAHHFKQAELPPTLEVLVLIGSAKRYADSTVSISYLYGVTVQLQLVPEENKKASDGEFFSRPGDRWEVAIEEVDPVTRSISAKPLRLLHREPFNVEHLALADFTPPADFMT
ncbi:MAG: hypothetical protein INR71_08415, partial [Terriglobus roseus]|nr:hypothetical protein [Terriglobus roseus]